MYEPSSGDYQKQILDLEEKLAQSEQNVKDFEALAITWKKGYTDLEAKHRRELGNLREIIDSLERDIFELKTKRGREDLD